VEKGILSGADEYVVKPLDADLFLAKVDALLRLNGQKAFASCNISATGQWDMNVDIVGISEIGLEVRSSVPVAIWSQHEAAYRFIRPHRY